MQTEQKSFTGHQLADLLVLVVLASFAVWYLLDTYDASPDILNLVLVLPVTLIVLTLCLVEFLGQLLWNRSRDKASPPESVRSVLPIVSLFAVYVLTLEWLGFDVGTALFLSASLWMHGERRWHWNVGYAISFAVIVSLLFSRLLPYPMPMLVFPSSY